MLLLYVRVFLPLEKLIIDFPIVYKVVVLIPPPVETGEAPININAINSNKLIVLNEVRFTVLKPAVLEETLVKIAWIQVMLFFSYNFNKTAPVIIKMKLIFITILE